MKIRSLSARDIRFPTSLQGDGSDAQVIRRLFERCVRTEERMWLLASHDFSSVISVVSFIIWCPAPRSGLLMRVRRPLHRQGHQGTRPELHDRQGNRDCRPGNQVSGSHRRRARCRLRWAKHGRDITKADQRHAAKMGLFLSDSIRRFVFVDYKGEKGRFSLLASRVEISAIRSSDHHLNLLDVKKYLCFRFHEGAKSWNFTNWFKIWQFWNRGSKAVSSNASSGWTMCFFRADEIGFWKREILDSTSDTNVAS